VSERETHHSSPLAALLASAGFARAYTLTALATVFSIVAIERTAGRVTLVTIIGGLCVIGVGMLIVRRDEYTLVRLVPTSVLIFLAWALVSLAWTTDTGHTATGWLTIAGIGLLAVVVAHVRDTVQSVRALGDVMRWLLSVSLGLEILSGILIDTPLTFLGIQGRIAEFGPIQGIFGTRNLLGFAVVIALITFLIEYRTQSVRVGVAIFSVSLGGILAVLSDSPTVLVVAMVVGAATAALVAVRNAPRERRTLLQWALGGLVIVLLGTGYVLRGRIIQILGAGNDLALRTDLWSDLLYFLRFRPVQGWGWFGPWQEDEFPFNAINYGLGQTHASALNAYLDVVLQLGWAGVILFGMMAGVALVRSWLVASERRSVVYAWTPLILVAVLANSAFESFSLGGFGWFLLVFCAVRAGQSRSWRERMGALELDDRGDTALPRADDA
jgi:exopolysaccharide production protein ExoQ